MSRKDTRAELNATLLHKALREGGPMPKDQLIQRMGIDERDFASALSFTRHAKDRKVLANEIVGVTSSAPFLYYLSISKDHAGGYISHRAKIADGHLRSVEDLLIKQADKWPKHEREIRVALRTVERMREDVMVLLADA